MQARAGNTDFTLNWAGLNPSTKDFYIAGAVWTSSGASPCYWKVTNQNLTPSPTDLQTGNGNVGGAANGIGFDSLGERCIAGTVGNLVPSYWINDAFFALTIGFSRAAESARNVAASHGFHSLKGFSGKEF